MDDPINVHLPRDLAIPDEGFHTPIRIRDLFAHTAGFEDLALGHLFAGDPNKLLTLEAYLKALGLGLKREPARRHVTFIDDETFVVRDPEAQPHQRTGATCQGEIGKTPVVCSAILLP